METVGERIRKIRTIMDYTQQEVAEKAGLNVSLYKHYELGIRNPKENQLKKIASALNVPVSLLCPIDVITPEGVVALVFQLFNSFGGIDMVENEGKIYVGLQNIPEAKPANETLREIKHQLDANFAANLFKTYEMSFINKPTHATQEELDVSCACTFTEESDLSFGNVNTNAIGRIRRNHTQLVTGSLDETEKTKFSLENEMTEVNKKAIQKREEDSEITKLITIPADDMKKNFFFIAKPKKRKLIFDVRFLIDIARRLTE